MEQYEIGGFKVIGRSIAGNATSLIFPELDICFDVAQGASKYFMSVNNFLISHGHADHAAGIPFIASQKSLNHLKGPRFFMPEEIVEPMHEIMRQWQKIENHDYPYEFVPVRDGETYDLKGDYFFKVFPTPHRVPSFGYTVFRRTRKLKAEFLNAERADIIAKRESGVQLYDFGQEPLITFTGDTKIEFIESRPWVKNSKILFVEATYLDEKKTVENAREWGHIHLDEIVSNLKHLNCEQIVLIHFSRRYSRNDIRRILEEKIPAEYKSRVTALIPAGS
jgi:ribonuclease Z